MNKYPEVDNKMFDARVRLVIYAKLNLRMKNHSLGSKCFFIFDQCENKTLEIELRKMKYVYLCIDGAGGGSC